MRAVGAVVGSVLCLGLLTACGSGDGEESPATREETPAGGETSSLDGKTIVLDPGHNGGNADHPEVINRQVDAGGLRKACDTTGTSSPEGYTEHAFTWDVARRLAQVLRDRGAQVELTRESDSGVGPCITERAATGGRVDADAALSIHADGAAPSGHGFHVIVPEPVGDNAEIVDPSRQLGLEIRDAYRSGTDMPYSTYLGQDGLDERDDLGGLNLAKVPTVFLEAGNMRNPGDAAKLSSASFRQRMAESLAQGFEHHFG